MAKVEIQDEDGTTLDLTSGVVALTGANQVVSNAPKGYRGFSMRETSGSASAVVRIYDNASAASGTILEEISLTSGESAREYYWASVPALNGIYVSIVSGAVSGSVRTS